MRPPPPSPLLLLCVDAMRPLDLKFNIPLNRLDTVEDDGGERSGE